MIEVRREDGTERIELEPVDSYRLELENVSDAIRGEGELLLGREDAVAQARALEALHESATSGTAGNASLTDASGSGGFAPFDPKMTRWPLPPPRPPAARR